jgi:hypothetical protein
MISITVQQRKPRGSDDYKEIGPGMKWRSSTGAGTGAEITVHNTTSRPLYLKWRI